MITCPDCGEPLLDELGAETVTVDGQRFRRCRASDHVVCESCGAVHRLLALRAAATARGDLAEDEGFARFEEDELVGEIIEALWPEPEGPAPDRSSTED